MDYNSELYLFHACIILSIFAVGVIFAYLNYIRQCRATDLQDVSKGVTTDKAYPKQDNDTV